MSEHGGQANQSGISYQNLVAAYYAASMLSGGALPEVDRIVAVRVEAPVNVDDVIVTFGDDHKIYIQAKEALRLSGDTWNKVWSDFERQFRQTNFLRDSDELHLVVGEDRQNLATLAEAFERIIGAQSFEEWLRALNSDA